MLSDAETEVLSAPARERSGTASTTSSSHYGPGSPRRNGASTVSGRWRLGTALLLVVACALIGGAIAADRDTMAFAPALFWSPRRQGIWNLALTIAVAVTHIRRLSKRPLAPMTVTRLLLVALVSFLATLWALPLHIYAVTMTSPPSSFGDLTARIMTSIACATTMVMAITLALLTKGLYRAERLSRQAHIAFMVFYVIAALGAVAAAAAAFAEDFVTETGGVAVAVAIVVVVIATETRYRYLCFVRNRPVHNHLMPMAILGWVALLAGYGIACFEAVRIVQALAGDSSLTIVTSPYLAACAAGLWLYRWAFSLLWTVAFYAATEGNTSRFLHASGSRFAAGLFGITSGAPALASTASAATDRSHHLDADDSEEDDADDLDALLLSDDEAMMP